jgi:hypothetical protein
MRMVPNSEYPHGFVAKALGDVERMQLLVDVKENVYTYEEDGEVKGGHGCVHFQALRRPGALWPDSWLKHIRSPQVEMNRRQSQLVEHANKVAGGIFIYPSGFAPFRHNLSNDPARIYEGTPTAHWLPQYVQPPEMPAYVVQLIQSSLSILNYIVSPFGEVERRGSSGIHFAQMQEERQAKAGPIVNEWETGWESFANLELKMWQRHQLIERPISVPDNRVGGRSGQWRREWYSSADLCSDIKVVVERGSALPTSAIATLAFYAEGAKSGMINPLEPAVRQRFYQDMKWQDALSTMDDLKADYDNAERNIHQAQDLASPAPMINPAVDDLAVHESIYRNFQKTSLFRSWDPLAQLRLTQLHGLCLVFLQRQAQQAMLMTAALGGPKEQSPPDDGRDGASGALGAAFSIGPGEPLGGVKSQLQGFGNALGPPSAGPHRVGL